MVTDALVPNFRPKLMSVEFVSVMVCSYVVAPAAGISIFCSYVVAPAAGIAMVCTYVVAPAAGMSMAC